MVDSLEILAEVCERCDDIGWKDFTKGKYLNAIYRANRLVARKYHLFRKIYQFTLSDITTDLTRDIEIDLPDMKEEFLVSVNDVNMRRKDNQLIQNRDIYSYYLFRQKDGTYLFNYINGPRLENITLLPTADISASLNVGLTDRDPDSNNWGKSVGDNIVILYECIPERDYDETEFVIPPNYEEEQIEYAVVHMAKLGIAKYQEVKGRKYEKIYRLYRKSDDFNKEVVETTEPLRIQLFQIY